MEQDLGFAFSHQFITSFPNKIDFDDKLNFKFVQNKKEQYPFRYTLKDHFGNVVDEITDFSNVDHSKFPPRCSGSLYLRKQKLPGEQLEIEQPSSFIVKHLLFPNSNLFEMVINPLGNQVRVNSDLPFLKHFISIINGIFIVEAHVPVESVGFLHPIA